jgi:hypothetical protein
MMSFEAWMKRVDQHLVAMSTLRSSDLADQTYHDWYDSGMTPKEAAIETLENEGFPFEEEGLGE